MTRPYSTFAEPTAMFTDALSGDDGTADPPAAAPLSDRFIDATADVTADRMPARSRRMREAAAIVVQGAATQPVPGSQPVAAQPAAVPAVPGPGLAPPRPVGAAPNRPVGTTAVVSGHRMPERYPAPQYPPSQYAPAQYAPARYAPAQYAAPQAQRPGMRPAPPRAQVPPRAPARSTAAARPRAASYQPGRAPQAPMRRVGLDARPTGPGRPARPAARNSRKASGGWAALLAAILFLVVSGAGRQVLDAISNLLNR